MREVEYLSRVREKSAGWQPLVSPANTDFVVAPLFLPDSRSSVDYIAMFEVLLENKPVLVLEVKPPSHLNLLSKRQTADDRIRLRMGDLVGEL